MGSNASLHSPNQAVKEILDTWENMKFIVVKYYKGTQERGYILGSVDDIIQCLDDNTVNLQSISGSRFVGPFLQTVHKWEKTLSLIGEVIEVRAKEIDSTPPVPAGILYGNICAEKRRTLDSGGMGARGQLVGASGQL